MSEPLPAESVRHRPRLWLTSDAGWFWDCSCSSMAYGFRSEDEARGEIQAHLKEHRNAR